MRTKPSIYDWIDAKTALPRLMSELAFGDCPVLEAANRASEALAVRAQTARHPVRH